MTTNTMRNMFGFDKSLYSRATSVKDCIQEYNSPGLALMYEQRAEAVAYRAPAYCADILAGLMLQIRNDAVILDAAAGSGQVGVELNDRGFRNVHALDGSHAMLDLCRDKAVYSQFICALLEDGKDLPLLNDSYDAVTVSGAILEHHLPCSSMLQFARVTRPGGYIVTAYSSDILNNNYGRRWEEETNALCQEGICSLYGRLVIPHYHQDRSGVVNVLQVL